MHDDTVYLSHIFEAIEQIEAYIAGVDYSGFIKNKMMIDAVVRELEIIGEATNNLSADFRRRYPEIPFRDMIDMRNVLIHVYFGVNTEIVWRTCQQNLPSLKPLIKAALEKR
jgi:uncharacterized protein with HEPN domain